MKAYKDAIIHTGVAVVLCALFWWNMQFGFCMTASALWLARELEQEVPGDLVASLHKMFEWSYRRHAEWAAPSFVTWALTVAGTALS